MKFFISIILTAFLAYVLGLYTNIPWWCFVFSSFLVAAAIPQRAGYAFLSGFAGLFLLWVLLAALKDVPNEHILSTRVAQVLPLGGSYLLLMLVTGLVAGLVSGFAAMTGSFTRKRKKRRVY
ncbi:hypothetical protein [Sediminibacterium soli]|uniref:hypothetical protein n=1 Tax=Sediminibacterium soli TaxID=2698829 RepID=UPI00137B3772|nr:hypothetical protein [Sediminibacterium soli]NCI47103.1 hypothetical protein [Sediminibacterium soli]